MKSLLITILFFLFISIHAQDFEKKEQVVVGKYKHLISQKKFNEAKIHLDKNKPTVESTMLCYKRIWLSQQG